MRLIFFGSGAFAQPTLRWLAGSNHEIAAVVTQPARASGRGRRVVRTPVHALADELKLETLAVEDVNAPDFVEKLRGLAPDLGLAIAFGQKLKTPLLAAMPGGCLNLHASLLPRYRGAAPINWAIVKGEERTGCTVFRMVERMDAGPILTSRWTLIKPEETAGELHDRLAAIGVDAVAAALELFGGGAIPPGTAQDESAATPAPKLQKADGFVDFARPAREVANHICGMTPWPGAATRFAGKDGRWEDVSITRARPAQPYARPHVSPGTIDERRFVAAADGFVEILEIRPTSGRLMSWADYVTGG
ncbi:MAG: methionyl-tRNA formyltransferase [Planctomycetes bacterium]|nr:methionyl-tRNA formyltransferase [Planctomycetota bacterium]